MNLLRKAICALVMQSTYQLLRQQYILIRTSSPDYKTGFGGQFGVQTDRVDKNAVGWEHNEKV